MRRRRQPNFPVNGEAMPRKPNSGDPEEVVRLWNRAYDMTLDYYTKTHGPNPEQLARNSAWRATNFYIEDPGIAGRYRKNPAEIDEGPIELTPPGEVAVFGRFLEITYYDDNGFHVDRFDAPTPHLLWDKSRKQIVLYPNIDVVGGGERVAVPSSAGSTYQMWHQRNAKEANAHRPPTEQLYVVGCVDTIVYRSDKWGEKNPDKELKGSAEYLHQVDDDVYVAITEGEVDAMLIRGGKLDAKPGGIVH